MGAVQAEMTLPNCFGEGLPKLGICFCALRCVIRTNVPISRLSPVGRYNQRGTGQTRVV